MFIHILMLWEDWTLWHNLKSLCQPDCLMLCWLCDKGSLYRNADCFLIKVSPNSIKPDLWSDVLSSLIYPFSTLLAAFSWAVALWYSAQTFISANKNWYSYIFCYAVYGDRRLCLHRKGCLWWWYSVSADSKDIVREKGSRRAFTVFGLNTCVV